MYKCYKIKMSTLDLDLSPQDRQIQLGLDIKERSNSFENIDYILSAKKLPGVPEKAEIIDLAVGKSFINKYKQKYNLA